MAKEPAHHGFRISAGSLYIPLHTLETREAPSIGAPGHRGSGTPLQCGKGQSPDPWATRRQLREQANGLRGHETP
jgi:hypothetical protein